MAVQLRRRDSRGWVEEGAGYVLGEVVVVVLLEGVVRLARKVSCRPGAEGAPRVGGVVVLEWEVRLVVVLGWADGGAMRRDWEGVSVVGGEELGRERRTMMVIVGW